MAEAARLAILEQEVSQLKVTLGVHEAGIEQEKKDLLDYMEKEFAKGKEAY